MFRLQDYRYLLHLFLFSLLFIETGSHSVTQVCLECSMSVTLGFYSLNPTSAFSLSSTGTVKHELPHMFFPSLLMRWNIFVCLVLFYVNVCINGCICRGVWPESNLWSNIYLSLAWNSLIRLVWLASDPQTSSYLCFSNIEVKSEATTLWILGIKPYSSRMWGKQALHQLSSLLRPCLCVVFGCTVLWDNSWQFIPAHLFCGLSLQA